MAVPRSLVVDDDRSGLYHCFSRCVRRAHLLASKDDHRRRWLVEQVHRLCDAFAIDVVSIAVLDNHMHLILRTLPELVATLSDREVAYRWLLVRPNRRRRLKLGLDPDGPPQDVEIELICGQARRIETLRDRLSSLSWFMKELKEPLARRANAEDGIPGRFWQDRFRCNALLDERAILCCASYIDMNPVEAGISRHALTANFTSVEQHLGRLWTQLAITSEERDLSAESAEAMEQLATRLDDVLFGPAVSCRRETHLADGAADPIAPIRGADTAMAGRVTEPEARAGESTESILRAAPDAETRDGEGIDSSGVNVPMAIAHATSDGASTQDTPLRDRARPCGPVPPLAVLNITLGQYFRRLAELSAIFSAADLARDPAAEDDLSRHPRKKGIRSTAPQAVLDRDDVSPEAVATVLRNVRFWGTAIGSTTSLAAEAVRRSRTRVICGLREGRSPPSRT